MHYYYRSETCVTIPTCRSMWKIRLLASSSYNFDCTSLSTPNTTPSLPRMPTTVLHRQHISLPLYWLLKMFNALLWVKWHKMTAFMPFKITDFGTTNLHLSCTVSQLLWSIGWNHNFWQGSLYITQSSENSLNLCLQNLAYYRYHSMYGTTHTELLELFRWGSPVWWMDWTDGWRAEWPLAIMPSNDEC